MKNILIKFETSNNAIDYRIDNEELLNGDNCEDTFDVNSISEIFGYITINRYLKILGNDPNFGLKWANNIYGKSCDKTSLLVAYDIFGGLFVIKDYQFGGEQIWYFAPDTMSWENLEITYKSFIKWICTDEFSLFYSDFPIEYIYSQSIKIEKDEVLLIYPYLWSKEYKTGVPSINVIPFKELFELNQDIYRQL
ncbi:DUF2625 family protein [Streptococcus suis]|nr:DUF2625 family protein [Streptococcus suis]NQR00838.1 DUF2625 family protein [Streptococcus suis]